MSNNGVFQDPLIWQLSFGCVILVGSYIILSRALIHLEKRKYTFYFAVLGVVIQFIITLIIYVMVEGTKDWFLWLMYGGFAAGMLLIISMVNLSIVQDNSPGTIQGKPIRN